MKKLLENIDATLIGLVKDAVKKVQEILTENKGCVIKTTSEILPYNPSNGADFSLKEMQDAVGGYVEIAHTRQDILGYTMLVDEDGIAKGKGINTLASVLAGGVILGDVVLCHIRSVK